MRLARLELRAYGHFTGFTLDLGDGGGVHLVYGDNEAGKSTALRALGSLLFGYPHRAEDTFLHQPRDIVLGGRLIGQDRHCFDLVRRRTGRNPLADAGGAPLAETAVARLLGGISRELFERVFALDHRRLRLHAQSLLTEGGALGISLAEAGAGIVGLKTSLDQLRGKRETLFLERGQRVINLQIKRLDDLRKEARQLMVSPESYRRDSQAIDAERDKLAAHRQRKQTVVSEASRLERLVRNLPRVAERSEKLAARAALGDFPLLPETAAQERVGAETALGDARRRLAEARQEIAADDERIAATSVDDAVLARAEDIARLAEWRGQILKDLDDLPRREEGLRGHFESVSGLLREAGLAVALEDLDAALPPAPRRRRVKQLTGQGRRLATRAEERKTAVDAARRNLEAAEARAAAAPPVPDVAALAAAAEAATRLGDIGAQVAHRRRTVARLDEALISRVKALGIADGSAATLLALPLPSLAAAQAAAKGFDMVDGEIAETARHLAQLDEEAAGIGGEIAALAAAGSPPSEEDIALARDERDRGWALVRGVYVERRDDLAAAAAAYAGELPLPDAFAARISEADRAVDALRRDAGRAARHAELIRRTQDIEMRATGLRERRTALIDRHKQAAGEWASLWGRSGLPPLPPGEAADWLAKAAAIRADCPTLDDARDELDALETRAALARDRLARALAAQTTAIAEDDPLEDVLDAARRLLGDADHLAETHKRLRLAVEEACRGRDEAERLLREHEAQDSAWRGMWTPAVAELGLAANAAPEEADSLLDILAGLDEERRAIADLQHRIDAMRADKMRFDKFVGALAAAALPGVPFPDMITASRAVERHCEETREASRRLVDLRRRVDDASAQEREASRTVAEQEAVLGRLCDLAGGVSPAELPAAEARSARRRALDGELAALERALVEDGAGRTLDAVVEECAGMNGDTAGAALIDARHLLDELAAQEEPLIRGLATLENALDERLSRTQAGAIEQEAALETAALAEEVERYVGFTVAETVLRAAIELYRERNQDPILSRASAIFAELTEGAYAGLRSDVDGKGDPVVLAQGPGGATFEVEALSDGTLDQLYLALRLAVVQEHNSGHEPVPFVADDLLVNFDDRRAMAALRVLAAGAADNIAGATQVLLFTHHAHLAALARRAVPAGLLREHPLPRAEAFAV